MKILGIVFVVASSVWVGQKAFAEEAGGPVAAQCKAEIEKHCADKAHDHGAVRTCLTEKKDELSEPCKKALESTGPAKGKGHGKKKAK